LKLEISIGGNAFIFFCPCYDHEKEKCIENIKLNEVAIFFNEEASYIKETLVPFSSSVMYGLSSYSPKGLLPMEMELGMWRIRVISLTIIAASVSAKIS